MAAVTVAVYVAGPQIDAYLFYGLVILGTALRFGLGASIWSSVGWPACTWPWSWRRRRRRPGTPAARGAHRVHHRRRGGRGTVQPGRDRPRDRERAAPPARRRGRARARACPRARPAQPARPRFRRVTGPRHHGPSHRRGAGPCWPTPACCSASTTARDGSCRRHPAAGTNCSRSDGGSTPMSDGRGRRGSWWRRRHRRCGRGPPGRRGPGRPRRHEGARSRVGAGADRGRRSAARRPGHRRGEWHQADHRLRRLVEAVADRAGPALQNAQPWSDPPGPDGTRAGGTAGQGRLSVDVSHELRTPLTSIRVIPSCWRDGCGRSTRARQRRWPTFGSSDRRSAVCAGWSTICLTSAGSIAGAA